MNIHHTKKVEGGVEVYCSIYFNVGTKLVFVVSVASRPSQSTLEEETAFPIGEQDSLKTVVKTKISLRWEWISEFPLVQADWYSGDIKYRNEIKILIFIFF